MLLSADLLAGNLHEANALFTSQHRPRRLGQLEHGITIAILLQQAVTDELIDPVAQLRLRVSRKQTVGAQPVMPERADAIRRLSAQHGNHVTSAEALLGAHDAGENLLSDH